MAAAGALGGLAPAKRRKARASAGPEAADTTFHVSSEPVEVAPGGTEGGTAPPRAV